MIDKHMKCQINNSNVRLAIEILDQQIDKQTKIKIRPTDPSLDQQIKCLINRMKFMKTNQILNSRSNVSVDQMLEQ